MAEHRNENEWRDPGHIDHWEDMLPEERRFERENSPVGKPGWGKLILVLAALYWIVNTLASCRNG
ncbi:MAG: hypothetical protein IKM84_04015 [Oscillospiraceae bacterium]|nr:hypothetical protein [Oscillospiraceae bacterium]MBR7056979.1 hypothetical protein [Oscillospiraceae bacterium]